MIVDLILDRKDEIEFRGVDTYKARDFYFDCLGYNEVFKGIADGITAAMDYGTEEEVKAELCRYIIDNEYNEKICEFINSVNWIDCDNMNTEQKMLERIQFKIAAAFRHYAADGWTQAHELRLAEIDGMIDMLSILTGKCYILADDGLKTVE